MQFFSYSAKKEEVISLPLGSCKQVFNCEQVGIAFQLPNTLSNKAAILSKPPSGILARTQY